MMASRTSGTPIACYWVSCAVFFLLLSLSFTAFGLNVFTDTDPMWHIAAGDLIRASHAIPEHDPWSFTAGDYRWLNMSWLWDVIFSYIHEQLHWHGTIAINAMIIATIILLVYAHCLIKSQDFFAAFLTTLIMVPMLVYNLRPLQITNLMVALWMLLLSGIARGHIRSGWLAIFPLLMLIWVNMHGGFMIGLILLGAFFLQALHEKNRPLAGALFGSGIAVTLTTLCTPYGISIVEAALRTLSGTIEVILGEWKPFTATLTELTLNMYLVLFCALVPRRPLPVLLCERWLSYIWLFLGLHSVRHLQIFSIISAPVFACVVRQAFVRDSSTPAAQKLENTLVQLCSQRSTRYSLLLLCIGVAVWLPSPMAARVYHQESIEVHDLDKEINFITQHYPKVRLLNSYDLGGILIYQTRGAIPVFVDARAGTAIPPSVFKDYLCFEKSCKDWEGMLDRYNIDGAIVPNEGKYYDRFVSRRGWQEVFNGPKAAVFMRDGHPLSIAGTHK